jgi:hypothetical protein
MRIRSVHVLRRPCIGAALVVVEQVTPFGWLRTGASDRRDLGGQSRQLFPLFVMNDSPVSQAYL